MTINVTISRDDAGNPDKMQVAVVNVDIYGNKSVSPGNIKQIEVGEPQTFCLHSSQELRVYETENELI